MRDGCNGAPVSQCVVQNAAPMQFQMTAQPYDYAFAVVNVTGAPLTVLGFDLYTASATNAPETAPTFIYRDLSGSGGTGFVHTEPDTQPVATGTIQVNGFPSWWSTSCYPAAVMQPGECFWIGFNPQTRISAPMNVAGAPGPHPDKYRRPNINNNAWTTFTTNGHSAFRLRCTVPPAEVARLQNTGLPQSGQQLQLTMSGGVAISGAFLIWAFNATSWSGVPLPFNLAGIGAPDCFNYTSTDVALFLLTDAQGRASFTTVVPPLPGFVFYNQAVLASPGNPLGLVTTNAGRGVIGN
jgi:hypothetical protein